MQFGELCQGCKGIKKCNREFTKYNCPVFDCPNCNRLGCDDCNQEGTFDLLQCPLEIIDIEIWNVIDLAVMYMDNGLPPIQGGVFDQLYNFILTAKFINIDRKYWKAKKNINV